MRKFIFILVLLASSALKAQIFNPTGGGSGVNNIPPGWTSNGFAYGSDINYYGGNNLAPWVLAPLPAAPSGQTRFLSVYSSNGEIKTAETEIQGLNPGMWYEIKYHVMTTSYKYNGGQTGLADQAILEVSGQQGGYISYNSPSWNTNIWVAGTLKFMASKSYEVFKFHVKESNAVGSVANLDISSIRMACNSNSQIGFKTPYLHLRCPGSTVNLHDAYEGYMPNGAVMRWYDNPTHSGAKAIVGADMISTPGTYYGFIYDPQTQCFNTDLATTSVEVVRADVKLKNNMGYITCRNATTFDLDSLIDTPQKLIPAGSTVEVRWFKNPTHSGAAVWNTKAVPVGTYYAFHWFGAPYNCYNTDLSTDKVEVVYPTQVELGYHKAFVICPSGTATLPDGVASGVPEGLQLRYYTNQGGTGSPVSLEENPIGTYYAFAYDPNRHCLNTFASTEKFEIAQYPEPVFSESVKVDCDSGTFDLTTIPYPGGNGYFVWFDNPNRVPKKFPNTFDPKKVPPGNYWAFMWDPTLKCYNVPVSSAKLTVIAADCDSRFVEVNVKVMLQGAMGGPGGTMRNDLQLYEVAGSAGLLPTIDPYGTGVGSSDINNPNVIGSVTDWIALEIRSAANPTTILEYQSLLLKSDGTIVSVNGTVPVFNSQAESVLIAVKHRNHVAILSNPVTFDTQPVTYDFTTGLDKVSVAEFEPDQMVLKNGKWCMWAGDVNPNQDLGIDATDYNIIYNINKTTPFDVYIKADLNMDGGVDATDLNIIYVNNLIQPFSTIVNYL